MNRVPFAPKLLAAIVCLLGCESDPEPAPVVTEVGPRIEIVVDGESGLVIDACVPEAHGVSCFERGRVTAEAAGESISLAFVPAVDEPPSDAGDPAGHYLGRLAVDAPGTEIVVSWDDGPGRQGRWRVSLPDVFTITAPLEGAVITGATDAEVTWSPSGSTDVMILDVSFVRHDDDDAGGPFESSYQLETAGDTGAAPVVVSTRPFDPGDRCDVDVIVARTRRGVGDGPIIGAIRASRRRSVSFSIVGAAAP